MRPGHFVRYVDSRTVELITRTYAFEQVRVVHVEPRPEMAALVGLTLPMGEALRMARDDARDQAAKVP